MMRSVVAFASALCVMALWAKDDFRVDGKDGASIQRAIDAAAAAGGGRVVVGAGEYPSGSLRLRSHVELHLEKGATIIGGKRSEDYFDFPVEICAIRPENSAKVFLYGWDLEDVAITGEGVVEGQGPEFFDRSKLAFVGSFWGKPPHPRPRMVQLVRCRNVRLEGVTFKDSPGWTMLIRLCEDVTAENIRVLADQRIINSDGIDFDGCRRVRVRRSTFKTGDDCLIVRSMREMGCNDRIVSEDIVFEDCDLDSACQTIRMGCPSDDVIRNVRIRNIRGRGQNGINFDYPARYLRPDDEGYVDLSDVLIENYSGTFYGNALKIVVEPGVKLRRIADVTVRNFTATSERPIRFIGNADSPLKNIVLENMTVTTPTNVTPWEAVATEPLVFSGCTFNGRREPDRRIFAPRGARQALPTSRSAGSWEAMDQKKPAEAASVIIPPEKFRTDSPHIRASRCKLTCGEHDFGGVVRPAVCLEYPFVTNRELIVVAPIGVDMMNDFQVIDFLVERTHPVSLSGKYVGGVHAGDTMGEKGFVTTQLVTHIHRDLVHTARRTSWMDCRKVASLHLRFAAQGWSDTNELHKVWISDLRFEKGNKWVGTERDKCFRRWLDFCDTYEPDLSDSSACLEPPKEGRLARPLKIVELGSAQAEIVAPKDVYGSIRLAARELRHWIGQMTGAELPIVEKPTGKKPYRIFLNAPEALERWKDDVAWLRQGRDIDGYFIHTDGNDIHIGCCVPNDATEAKMASLGLPPDACPVGVFRGAIAFLENNSTILFACKDKEFGTVYDKSEDFIVRWGEGRERPATCGRGWLTGNDYSNVRKIDINALDLWCARTRGNLRMPHRLSGHGNGSGEMIEYVPNTEPYQTFDGEKRWKHSYYNGQICLSAPDCLELAISNGVEKVKRYRSRQNYPVVSCGFWNEDNWRVCACEGCTKPIVCEDGTVLTSCGKTRKQSMSAAEQAYRSTQYMMFVNSLADGIAARCPGVKTEILAYLFQRPTPKCRISPNVIWTYCPYHCRYSYNVPVYHPLCANIHKNFTTMLTLGGEMHVYDYQAFGGITKAETAIPEAAAEDYRYYDSLGVKSIGAEFAYVDNVKNPAGLMNGWLFNRVGWDADLRKVEGLRKYFLRRLYREGAPAAEEYFARYRREAIRKRPPGTKPPKMLTGAEAKEVFGRYLDKITNPIAKVHYGILMNKAVGGK